VKLVCTFTDHATYCTIVFNSDVLLTLPQESEAVYIKVRFKLQPQCGNFVWKGRNLLVAQKKNLKDGETRTGGSVENLVQRGKTTAESFLTYGETSPNGGVDLTPKLNNWRNRKKLENMKINGMWKGYWHNLTIICLQARNKRTQEIKPPTTLYDIFDPGVDCASEDQSRDYNINQWRFPASHLREPNLLPRVRMA
jgi:hypothetical protein